MLAITKLALLAGTLFALVGCSRSESRQEQFNSFYAAARCGGSPSSWSKQGSEYGELMAHNTLEVAADGLKWNGVAVSAAILLEYLPKMNQLNPHVNMQVAFDDHTNCQLVNEIRGLISRNLQCSQVGACVEYSERELQAQLERHAVY